MIPTKAKLERSAATAKGGGATRLSEALFIIWAIGVSVFWIGSTPQSAPQQAALAGQALVLICIPYCVVSVLQRGWAAREAKTQQSAAATIPEA